MSTGVAFYCLGNTDAHTRCLATVVKAGANVNSTRFDGQPVLLEACESAKVDQCLHLLKHGADPNSRHEVCFWLCVRLNSPITFIWQRLFNGDCMYGRGAYQNSSENSSVLCCRPIPQYIPPHTHTGVNWVRWFIMRPSSLGGGRILRRTLSVCLSVSLSVCLSVHPSRYHYRASRGAT